MVVISIPASSIRIAVVCRGVWGVMFLVPRLGQSFAAVEAEPGGDRVATDGSCAALPGEERTVGLIVTVLRDP